MVHPKATKRPGDASIARRKSEEEEEGGRERNREASMGFPGGGACPAAGKFTIKG